MDHRIIGAQLNSAIYLICVFLAGGWTNHIYSSWLAIGAMGLTYLSYVAQLAMPVTPTSFFAYRAANVLVGISILLGAAAGLFLMV